MLAWLLAGCTSPEPRYFTLAATPGVPSAGAPRAIMLRRPGIAGYLDRPEIVRSGGGVQLRVTSGERWGEPFGDLFGRTLGEDLSRRLPGSSVYTEAGSISTDPDATLEVDVQRFDADPSGEVVLLMQISVARGRNHDGSPSMLRITVKPGSDLTADVVAAMSQALGQASDQIAVALRAASTAAPDDGRTGRARRPAR